MKTHDDTYEHVMKKFYRVYGDNSPIRLRFKRRDLAGLFNELGYTTGAEIGVHKGEYSAELCSMNADLKLYAIDPWTMYERETKEAEEEEPFSQDQDALDSFYAETVERLAPYNCDIIRKTSMEAVKDFEPDSLDFIYLDANHDFKNVTEDLAAWTKTVRSGGIVSGHDYGHFKYRNRNLGSKRAIDNYVKEHNIRSLFLVNRNYQTSWFFINE